jgi:hypothetical protein
VPAVGTDRSISIGASRPASSGQRALAGGSAERLVGGKARLIIAPLSFNCFSRYVPHEGVTQGCEIPNKRANAAICLWPSVDGCRQRCSRSPRRKVISERPNTRIELI